MLLAVTYSGPATPPQSRPEATTVPAPVQVQPAPPVQPAVAPAPVQPAAQPVQPAAQPVQPAAQPVQPAAQPVQPAAQPVQPAAPVQPAPAPVQPAAPVRLEPAAATDPTGATDSNATACDVAGRASLHSDFPAGAPVADATGFPAAHIHARPADRFARGPTGAGADRRLGRGTALRAARYEWNATASGDAQRRIRLIPAEPATRFVRRPAPAADIRREFLRIAVDRGAREPARTTGRALHAAARDVHGAAGHVRAGHAGRTANTDRGAASSGARANRTPGAHDDPGHGSAHRRRAAAT